MITDDYRIFVEKYSRQILLDDFGIEKQKQLSRAKVLIIGCGGLGCPSAIYLASNGVGQLGLVDFDLVENTNLHRQVGHTESRIGVNKAESLKMTCLDLNSTVQVISYPFKLTKANGVDIISQYDVILDCTDNPPTRYLISDLISAIGGKPLVSASTVRLEGHLTVFFTKHPQGGNESICYRCLHPQPPPVANIVKASQVGVLGLLPGIMGMLQAAEAIKIISNLGEVLLGKLLIYNFKNLSGFASPINLLKKRKDCICQKSKDEVIEFINEFDYDQILTRDVQETKCNMAFGINSKELSLMKHHEPLIVDIRPARERKICSVQGSIFCEEDKLITNELVQMVRESLTPGIEKVIILCCREGQRASVVLNNVDRYLQDNLSNEYVYSLHFLIDGIFSLVDMKEFNVCRY